MIEPDSELSIRRQCELLRVSRSGFYYEPEAPGDASLPSRSAPPRVRRHPRLGATLDRGIKVSMDRKGRYIDNIFVERLCRSLKYEEVYLHAYDGFAEARAGIGAYMRFFNEDRFHEALGYQTPVALYDTLEAAA